MHAADRHIERWAPETTAHRSRSLRSLGFVDRLVSPWLETAQRSASMRLLGGYSMGGFQARASVPGAASWVFPRPWYQDELDWMAAAREAETADAGPTLFTTRGTFVAPSSPGPQQQVRTAMPAALYEYVAPSLSVAAPQLGSSAAPGSEAPASFARAYSPLVP
ncbi:MAG: hypothetical protein KIT31_24665, partial [Deltaproteobacteria bacterium]|nr:hypothetical protein [Deltaproteobacteria bacterium]